MEKKDRADDAIQALQNSIKHGILPGGGMAYAYLANKDFAKNFKDALMAPISILSKGNAVQLTFEIYSGLVSYNSEHGIVGIDSEHSPVDSYSTVVSVLEQAITLAKLVSSIKATVVSNTGGNNGTR